jgi:hypothetical protein
MTYSFQIYPKILPWRIVENIVLFYHVHCSVHFPAIFVLLFFPPFCTTLNFLFHIKLFDILVCTRIGSAI